MEKTNYFTIYYKNYTIHCNLYTIYILLQRFSFGKK